LEEKNCLKKDQKVRFENSKITKAMFWKSRF
jgi:hypothetical protein